MRQAKKSSLCNKILMLLKEKKSKLKDIHTLGIKKASAEKTKSHSSRK